MDRVGKYISEVKTERYRGYDIVHDRAGAEIWSGGQLICSEKDLWEAKEEIDAWHNAR